MCHQMSFTIHAWLIVHEAHELMKRMPFVATASMWGSHLVSCRIHGNLELAEIAAKNLLEMEP